MDNFDVRKFITEAKLSEQKKAYVAYTDGSTEDRTFHQSVSDDKIKKMLAPGTFIDGKQVLKVLVGDSLDQPMNEEKDVLEPEESEEDKKKEESPFDYDKEKVEAIIPGMEKRLATAIHSAYNPDEDSDLEAPDIDQKYILSQVKAIKDNKDLYYQLINDRDEEGALKAIADKISLDYLKKYVDKNNIERTGQLGNAYLDLDSIFENFTDMQYPSDRIAIYIRNK